LPACVATAKTREEVLELIEEAIKFHIQGLKKDGEVIPEPASSTEITEIAAKQVPPERRQKAAADRRPQVYKLRYLNIWLTSSAFTYYGVIFAISYFGIFDGITFLDLIPVSYVIGMLLTLLIRYWWKLDNDKIWSGKIITGGIFFLVFGHLGHTSMVYLLYTMKTGGASGLMLLPSIIFIVLGYGLGFLFIVTGLYKNSMDLNENTPDKAIQPTAKSGD
jgi:hypothetical protein